MPLNPILSQLSYQAQSSLFYEVNGPKYMQAIQFSSPHLQSHIDRHLSDGGWTLKCMEVGLKYGINWKKV